MARDRSTQPNRTDPSAPGEVRRNLPDERGHESATAAPPWLMREKVAVPQRVAGYFNRSALMERIRPTDRRGTVLKAPGGFGKTTLLSECCRRARETGALAAWLTLDVQDVPEILEAYLVLAFQEAGLSVLGGAPDSGGGPIGNRIENLLRAIAMHGGPCVLALDELERIADPESLALVSTLLQWGPPNLCFAIACRELPVALDIGSSVLAGNTALFDASQLRFSAAEIGGFLGARLSRRELDALARESGGWPIALRIVHNERSSATTVGLVNDRDVAGNWIESRLWRGLGAEDRQLLLDVGLFGRIDGGLLDEVLEGHDLIRRVEAMPALAGLLESVRVDGADTWRLHPLIREHCGKRRLQETPGRFRSLQRKIAEALARRGETVTAMRHAAKAEATELTAGILEDAGAMRLWLTEGIGRLQSAYQLLTPDITATHPRLALARCVVEMTTGRLAEARRTYGAAIAARPKADSRDTLDFDVDECLVRGMLCLYGCESFSSERMTATLGDYLSFADAPDTDTAMRGSFELGLCMAHNLKAEFDTALHWSNRAERRLSGSRYIRMHVDLYRGQAAMARGRSKDAAGCYASAYRIARTRLLRDPGQVVFVEVMMRELDLETHQLARLERAPLGIPKALFAGGTPLASFAAASAMSAELTLLRNGVDAAIEAVDEVFEYARETGLPALVRYLGGLRVQLLSAAGRSGAAESAWRAAGLPDDDAGCLDLDGQSWRELESISCARLKLLLAAGRFDAGRRFADSLFAVAGQRGLRRTWMRGLALSVALEHAAGQPARSEARLVEFLRLYAETDYAAGAARERAAFVPLLESLLGNGADPRVRAPAEQLFDVLRGVGGAPPQAVRLTPRELQILEHLATMQDKEIARALGLSVPGVRYHVAKIFAKLGVKDRLSAVDHVGRAGLRPDS